MTFRTSSDDANGDSPEPVVAGTDGGGGGGGGGGGAASSPRGEDAASMAKAARECGRQLKQVRALRIIVC